MFYKEIFPLFFRPSAPDPFEDLRGFGGELGGKVGFEVQVGSAEHLEALCELMAQKLPRVNNCIKCGGLFFRRSGER